VIDVKLSVNSANSICKAYRILCESRKFDFTLDGAICRSENVNGIQMFALREEIRPRFNPLLTAIAGFTKQLLAIDLNDREINSFLGEFFELRAYAAEATRVVRETLSELDITDARTIVAVAGLLEDKMDKAIHTIDVTITAEMLEAKKRKLDKSFRDKSRTTK
jgi:hypothetical protein